MARSTNKSRKKTSGDSDWSNEIAGIGMMGGGLLLLLSLVSYTPSDLPMGIPFTGATWLDGFAPDGEANNPRHNFIGPVGALFGFIQIQLLGAAGYLLSLGLIWLGIGRLFFEAEFTWRTWVGFGVLLISGACLLGVQDAFLASWPERYWIVSPGGAIGKGLGAGIFKGLLNTAGAVIVLSMVYLVSTFLLLGLHPVKFAKGLMAWTTEVWGEQVMPRIEALRSGKKPKSKAKAKSVAKTKAKKAAAKKAKAEEEEEWEYEDAEEEEEWEYEEEEAEDPALEQEENGQVTLPLQEVPKPQIIDASKRAKPLADIGARPFERKKQQHAALTTEGFEDYELPGFDLLEYDEDEAPAEDNSDELMATQKTIVDTCKAFGVDVTAGDITRGPTITRYEIYPSLGLRVSRIAQLEPDLARATRAERINILAPIPGKDTVGIEIANDKRMPVALRELLQDDEFRSSKKKIPLALGKDVYGRAVIGDLAAMPHCLVAGATGAGKSVCINSIIASMLFKFGPDELRFIMVDPKVVEMQMYAKLPHLVVPVVTDPRRVVGALKWCVNEMERRYKIFAKEGVRNFDSFNARVRKDEEKLSLKQEEAASEEEEEAVEGEEEEWEYEEGEEGSAVEGEEEEWEYEEEDEEVVASDEESEEVESEAEDAEEEVDTGHVESIAAALEDGELGPTSLGDDDEEEDEDEVPDRFPYIVVIIDELADLMQTAPADVEMCIARIAQKARAAGIHLIIATQTPRADVVTGIIKANIPSRIAFQVSSSLDSRVILDTKGAEKLVGKGDMLFLPPGSAKLERSQGAFVSDEEVESIVEFCSTQSEQRFEESIQKVIESGGDSGGGDDDVNDADEECLQRCIEVVMTEQKASTSLLQRRLRLGYTRAARMIDILEQRGIVGPADGAKPREVYAGAAAAAAE